MADIRNLQQNQALLRSEADQLKSEILPILHGHGECWTDRLDQMITAFSQHDEDPWRVVGMLAQLGFLHLLESYESTEGPEPPDGE